MDCPVTASTVNSQGILAGLVKHNLPHRQLQGLLWAVCGRALRVGSKVGIQPGLRLLAMLILSCLQHAVLVQHTTNIWCFRYAPFLKYSQCPMKCNLLLLWHGGRLEPAFGACSARGVWSPPHAHDSASSWLLQKVEQPCFSLHLQVRHASRQAHPNAVAERGSVQPW